MRPIPMIRAAGVLAFARFLRSIGAPVEKQWERLGLPLRALAEPEYLLPLHAVNGFVEKSARDQGIDDLGLRVGAQSTLKAIGQFGAAIGGADTLGRAFRTMRDVVPAHNSAATYWVVHEGRSARLCRRLRDEGAGSRQIDLFTVALMTHLVRLAAGPDWTPSRVELQSTGPLAMRDTGVLADAQISVGAPFTSVELPRSLLRRPLAARPTDSAVAAGAPTAAWLRGAPPRDFVASLAAVIETLLETEHADVAAAAAAAGTTVRSLQRRLALSGTSYSAVLDAVRLRVAIRMLDDPQMKLVDVSVAIGFSDPAHFTRAFRRWTSTTPRDFRRLLLRGADALERSA